ncbi:hypothetical protein [uncultured Microbacterium sp.]|uniref:hypothetical protein n=1 Tax=uncultured Microbacterium sp. TaxID=191216 RepID=UPI0028D81950|nr:hypothetical protein [uncultured Microbacterium sp.]
MTAAPPGQIKYDVFALAEVRQDRYKLLAETVDERLRAFKCERSLHLQEFARSRVSNWEDHGHSRTYVIVTARDETVDVAGFFTVGMTALNLERASRGVRQKLMGNITLTQTGAYSIAELARSDDYTSAQLPGTVILDEAKNVIRRARAYVAGRFVVVDARREVFEHLYQPAGFKEIDLAEPPMDMSDVEFVTACAVVKSW